jgi:hypothetical protein
MFTKYQHIEQLANVRLLCSHCPWQLLVEMMELCPDDEEASSFIVFLFLEWLRVTAWLSVTITTSDSWR